MEKNLECSDFYASAEKTARLVVQMTQVNLFQK